MEPIQIHVTIEDHHLATQLADVVTRVESGELSARRGVAEASLIGARFAAGEIAASLIEAGVDTYVHINS